MENIGLRDNAGWGAAFSDDKVFGAVDALFALYFPEWCIGVGEAGLFADILLNAGSQDAPTPRVQEAHMVIYHTICELVEAAMATA